MLSKAQKTKIYYRIYRKYSRLAKRLGKNFKEVTINGKYFREALDFELRKEEQLNELGKSPSHFKPSRDTERRIPKRKSPYEWLANPSDVRGTHSEKCRCRACSGAFSDPNLIGEIPESEGDREARKELERIVNEELEAQQTEVCPYCKSSICREGECQNDRI